MTYQTPEGKIKAEIKRLLDEYAAYYFMPQPGYLCRNGIADYIVCLNGTYIAIEAKAGRKVPTAIQQRELDKVNAAGGVALCINAENIHALPLILDEIAK